METGKPVREILQQIAIECQESGATKWQVLKILKELESGEGGGKQLKRKAAEVLEKLNPEAAKVFLSFEKLKVYTSKEQLEQFDRGNIIKSLLKETNVSRHVAEKIGSEVEDRIKDLRIDYLNTQLIREMVNVKLLEYGHEPVHTQYARIGMPVFEVKKKLEAGFFENPEILREYNWLSVIPARAREMHFEKNIHISNAEDFSTKICCSAKFVQEGIEEALLEIRKSDQLCSHPLTLKAANYTIAALAKKEKKKILEGTGLFMKLLKVLGKKRVIELPLYLDSEWEELSGSKKQSIRIANHLLSEENKEHELVVSVDSKYQLKLLEKKILSGRITIVNNSREKNTAFPFGTLQAENLGVLQNTGINLEKIAESTYPKEQEFFGRLKEITEAVNELNEEKKKVISKRTYFEKWMAEETSKAVSLAGLYNACTRITPENREKTAESIIALFQKEGYAVLSMGQNEQQLVFGASEDSAETQKLLMGLSSKIRKSYGFTYSANTLKEAEMLLNDCPSIISSGERNSSGSPR